MQQTEAYRVQRIGLEGRIYRLMEQEEVDMMMELFAERHVGGPYPFCSHLVQQYGRYWILDNGIH